MRLPIAVLEEIISHPTTFKVDAWETPASKYPLKKIGRAQITRSALKKGFYFMESVRGYDRCYVNTPVPVTSLKLGREIVMIDDPLQWCGMQDLAKHCKGKVMVAGLGLGLIAHALQENKDVTEVIIIENNFDVIELMVDNLPKENPKWQIIPADVYLYLDHFAKYQKYDTIVLDIWWGMSSRQMAMEMLVASSKAKYALPDARLMIWGKRDPELNPAVTARMGDLN